MGIFIKKFTFQARILCDFILTLGLLPCSEDVDYRMELFLKFSAIVLWGAMEPEPLIKVLERST